MLDRIKVDPQVCEGRPTVRGASHNRGFILKLLGEGYTADEIMRDPQLAKEDA